MSVLEKMKEAILGAVHGGTSFVDLERLPGFKGGDRTIGVGGFENLVAWSGMTEVAENALVELVRDGKILMRPTSVMIYGFDGGGLSLPVAHKMKDYSEPHWAPVVFNPGVA